MVVVFRHYADGRPHPRVEAALVSLETFSDRLELQVVSWRNLKRIRKWRCWRRALWRHRRSHAERWDSTATELGDRRERMRPAALVRHPDALAEFDHGMAGVVPPGRMANQKLTDWVVSQVQGLVIEWGSQERVEFRGRHVTSLAEAADRRPVRIGRIAVVDHGDIHAIVVRHEVCWASHRPNR
jgi:hypothetical protein